MATPNLLLIPSGYKAGKLYSIIPSSGNGDLDFVRASGGTRIDKDGNIEEVGDNVPRLDYDGDCPALLVEPQRTNLITYSQQFDNAAWSKQPVGTGIAPQVTPNAGMSPDGTMNADRVVFDARDASGDRSMLRQTIPALSTTGIATYYVKSFDGNPYYIAGHTGGTIGDFLVTDKWQRITFSSTSTGTTYNGLEVRNGFTTGAYADILVYGGQVEDVDTYPTSYIKTEASAVTRLKDLSVTDGLSDVISSVEGSIYLEVEYNEDEGAEGISISDGTNSNNIRLYRLSGNELRLSSSVYSVNISTGSGFIEVGKKYKVVMNYSPTKVSMYINGASMGEQTSGLTPPSEGLFDSFRTTRGDTTSAFTGKLGEVAIYDTMMSDSESKRITQL